MNSKQLFSALLLTFSMPLPIFAQEPAIYLGVKGYGSVSHKESFYHEFYQNGQTNSYQIASDSDFSLENNLANGYFYDISLENNIITEVNEVFPVVEGWVSEISDESISVGGQVISLADDCQMGILYSSAGSVTVQKKEIEIGTTVQVFGNPATAIYENFCPPTTVTPITGTAGERSLKNFIATAMMPVGNSLYIYGGHWDWQDLGSSNLATSIGLSDKVTDFFLSQNENFSYMNRNNYSASYFPHQSWNMYHFAGMDCSGYVGWAMYNTLHAISGEEGYVLGGSRQAYDFAQRGLGTFSRSGTGFQVGDVFSMDTHVWIYLGDCPDGSFMILHSTPSASITGALGGGVQLTGVGNSANCQAAQLASYYMETYFPIWGQRYNTNYQSKTAYASVGSNVTGKFSWNISPSGLLDLDGYRYLTAEQILEDLFQKGSFDGFATRGESISYIWESLNRPSDTGSHPFTDVSSDLLQPVSWAYEQGISAGTTSTTFSPNLYITRGEFLCYLWNLSQRPLVEWENPFEDLDEDAYYSDAISWALSENLTVGTTPTTFSPDDFVTRDQIVYFLRKYLA